MTLPYDYARCEGASEPTDTIVGAMLDWHSECLGCQRRTSPPSPYRQSYIMPPQFIDGRCPQRIGEGEEMTNGEMERDFLKRCRDYLVRNHEMDSYEAEEAAQEIAESQNYRYGGNVRNWLPPHGAAEQWISEMGGQP